MQNFNLNFINLFMLSISKNIAEIAHKMLKIGQCPTVTVSAYLELFL